METKEKNIVGVPLLYIVAINFNSSAHTVEMVQSILKSDYENIQIVIVDNASIDSDYENLNSISEQVILLRSEENLGFSGGNNLGIRYAIDHLADYIMIINNDTIVEPDAIRIMMEAVCKNEIDVVSPKILFWNEKETLNYAGGSIVPLKGGISIWGLGQKDEGQYNAPKEISYAHGCCTLASAQTWQEAGLMDEKYFLYYEDVALSNTFLELGKKMWYMPDAVIYHKESASTKKYSANYQYYLCRNRLAYIREYVKFPTKIAAYCYTTLFVLKNLKRKNFQLNNIKDAWCDYRHRVYGKRSTKPSN